MLKIRILEIKNCIDYDNNDDNNIDNNDDNNINNNDMIIII